MNKTELVANLSKRMDIPVAFGKTFFNVLQEEITNILAKGESIDIQNFGSLHPWQQVGREGRNPKTGVYCYIRPRVSVKFKPGGGLLEKLNPKTEDNNDNI